MAMYIVLQLNGAFFMGLRVSAPKNIFTMDYFCLAMQIDA